jgi:hypothetical protein
MRNGIVKQALSAARMRYIAASLPEHLARKKLGNKRYDRISKEINSAAERLGSRSYFGAKDGYATLIEPKLDLAFRKAPRYSALNHLKSGNPDYKLDGEHWREIKRSLFPATELESHNVVSRDDLLSMGNAIGHSINPEELKHAYYFNLFPNRPANSKYVASAARAMGVDGDDAAATIANHKRTLDIMKELPYHSGGSWRDASANKINKAVAGSMPVGAARNVAVYVSAFGDQIPRSVKSILRRIDGTNLLEEGTRANVLYRRLRNSNNTNIEKLISGVEPYTQVRALEQGNNAQYIPVTGAVAVSPKIKSYEHVLDHERAHEAMGKMSLPEHASIARELMQRLRDVSIRNGLNIPWGDANKMNEAVTDGYRMMSGGTVDPARVSRWKGTSVMRVDEEVMKRIDSLKGAGDVEKEMLRQLYANYNHNIFSSPISKLRNV